MVVTNFRSHILLLVAMSIFLPFWLTIGKSMLFGIGGWVGLAYIFTVAPAIFVIFWLFLMLLTLRKDTILTNSIGIVDARLLLALYTSIFAHGIFLVDGGDTAGSLNSIATKYFGITLELSSVLSGVFLVASSVLILACLSLFIYEMITKRAIQADKLF